MDDSPKRFDRIVAILIQLQSKRIVRAQDLAERFEVSLRTIYRDIRTLEASGVPIYSEAGVGYSLSEGYRLPPVMFTREEAGSFIAAEKLMQKFTDKELGKHFASATYKLKAVLKSSDKEWVSTIESNILMQPANQLFNEKTPNTLSILFNGIANKTQVILTYMSAESDELMERKIEPVGIFHENNNWYVLAYCHIRADYRQFRADRIYQIRSSELPFTMQHQALESYLKNDKKKMPTTKVRILVEKKIAKHLEYEKKYHGFVSQKLVGEYFEMNFLSTDLKNGFSRWFLMFGDYAKILEPESLKADVLELMEKVRSNIYLRDSVEIYLSQK